MTANPSPKPRSPRAAYSKLTSARLLGSACSAWVMGAAWVGAMSELFQVVAGRAQRVIKIEQAFLPRYSAPPDDAGLQINHQSIDLRRAQLGGSRIQIVRRGAQRPAAAWAHRVGPLIEARHIGARAPAADGLLEGGGIEPAGAQVGAGRRLVAVLLAVGKGAVTIRTSRGFPQLQSGLHSRCILGKARGRACQRSDNERDGCDDRARKQ